MNIYTKTSIKFLLSVIFLIQTNLCLSAPEINKAAYPDWVEPQNLPKTDNISYDKIQNGVHYLLVDTQVIVNPEQAPQYFYHYADHIVNQAGVEGNSQINLSYDPAYQKLVLHSLRIIRNSEVIDKIDSARMSLIQREEDMDELIYNGRTTLNMILDDVRIGDTIEYSYSIIGMNPVYQNIFAYNRYLEWGVAVEKLSLRLVWNKPAPLYHKLVNSNLQLSRKKTDKGDEYLVQANKVDPVRLMDNTPPWFLPWGMVYFSELKSWEEVARWSENLYRNVRVKDSNIEQIISDIKTNNKGVDKQISAALRFVQDEVRYLGIELGQNSHLPNTAFETLKNRYGDCKDKTVLLLTLLDGLGVEAFPALVNTEEKLNDRIPSIHAFDHVITYLQLNGMDYWLDPTRRYQHGGINTIHQPDFGHALVLREDENKLTSMQPQQSKNGTFVKDTFELPIEGEATFSSITEFYGWNAEYQRHHLEDKGRDQLQEGYLDFFKGYYPSIVLGKSIEQKADPELNTVTTIEHYKIPEFWEVSQDKRYLEAGFYPNMVTSELEAPDEQDRSQPLYLSHPVNVEQEIILNFPDDNWHFDNGSFVEENKFFLFSSETKFHPKKRQLILTYRFNSRAEYVSPEEYPAYLSALKNTENYQSYGIQKKISPESSSVDDAPWYLAYLSPVSILSVYAAAYLLVMILWLIDRKHKQTEADAIFFPVSLVKLTVMWLLTFGFYGAYWFYKNFRYIKEKENNASMPVARGIFYSFWYFPLWAKLKNDCDERFDKPHLPGKSLTVILAVAFFATVFVGNADALMVPALLVSACLVLPLANYIQFINGPDSKALSGNSKWKVRHFLLAILSIPVFILSIGSEIGFLPSDSVIKGSRILSSDTTVMQRRGIISPADKIELFYSDAFLAIGDDGNGFTQRHVFSYWKEEDGSVSQEQAVYKEIDDIQVEWKTEFGGNSIVTIQRKDGSQFLLFVSNTDSKDRLFVKTLKERWLSRR